MTEQTQIKDHDLRGKDYFNLHEAAHYAGVSESQFRKKAPKLGIHARPFMGKKLYRRDDIQAAIENER